MNRLVVPILACVLAFVLFAQTPGMIKGVVADESGAVIPGANVTATGPNGVVKQTTAAADGTYALNGLAAGLWTVQASSPGLTQFQPLKVNLNGGVQTANLQLNVVAEKQEVTVQEQANNVVTTDPSSNASSLVLKGEDLDSLSDDPDDLQQDLEALAGPSAGPDGGQIYIDGFTGGRLPPKESIREIRINQNPFSSEFDKLGYGRIEILTKPGTDKFHGQVFLNDSNGIFNSRNPFLTSPTMPDFNTRQYGGNVSGPLSGKASFFLDFDRREIDDNGIVNALILDPNTLNPLHDSTFAPASQRRTTLSPRVDYQLNSNNTLMARYTYTQNDRTGVGIGDFSLPSRGYSTSIAEHTVQLTETAVLNSKFINETRFQWMRDTVNEYGNNNPVINVLSSFVEGGAGIGPSYNLTNHWELQNYTSYASGVHSMKFGVRVRAVDLTDVAQNNFGGTFTFSGTPQDPNSLDVYRQTLLGLQAGQTLAQLQALGYGPSQFSINAGNPPAP